MKRNLNLEQGTVQACKTPLQHVTFEALQFPQMCLGCQILELRLKSLKNYVHEANYHRAKG